MGCANDESLVLKKYVCTCMYVGSEQSGSACTGYLTMSSLILGSYV